MGISQHIGDAKGLTTQVYPTFLYGIEQKWKNIFKTVRITGTTTTFENLDGITRPLETVKDKVFPASSCQMCISTTVMSKYDHNFPYYRNLFTPTSSAIDSRIAYKVNAHTTAVNQWLRTNSPSSGTSYQMYRITTAGAIGQSTVTNLYYVLPCVVIY